MADRPQQDLLSHSHKPREWIKVSKVIGNTTTTAYEQLGTLVEKTIPGLSQRKAEIKKSYKVRVDRGEMSNDILREDLVNIQRKTVLLNYLENQRAQFSKLLALAGFSRDAIVMKQCQDYYESLEKKQEYLDGLHADLNHYASWIHNSSQKNPDLHTAIDVLTSGTYQRFPTLIKSFYTFEPITDEEIKETLEKLNVELKLWMLSKEVVPAAFSDYKIHDGRITFIVKDEFEVSVTRSFRNLKDPRQKYEEKRRKEEILREIVGLNESFATDPKAKEELLRRFLKENSKSRVDHLTQDRWEILDLKIMIQSNPKKCLAEIPLDIGEQNLRTAKDICSKILDPSQKSIPEIPKKLPKLPSKSKRLTKIDPEAVSKTKIAPYMPLVRLHEFLHEYCLHHQMNLMYYQLSHLRATRWKDNISVQLEEGKFIKIYYWRWAHVPFKGDKSRRGMHLAFLNNQAEIESRKKFHDKGKEPQQIEEPQPQSVNWIEISIVDDYPTESSVHFGKKRLSKFNYAMETSELKYGSIQNRRGLNYPTQKFQVRWSAYPSSDDKRHDHSRIIRWNFEPTSIDIEDLLLFVIRSHADYVIKKFNEAMSKFISEGNSTFKEEDIQIAKGRDAFRIEDKAQAIDYDAKKYWMTPVMRVRMTEDKWIDVSVDLSYGKIAFERHHRDFNNVLLKSSNADITQNPQMILKTLIRLKIDTIMDEVEAWAKQMELPIDKDLALPKEDVSLFNTDAKPKFYRFVSYPGHYLVAGTVNCKLKYWLIRLRELNRPASTHQNYLEIRPKQTINEMIPLDLDHAELPAAICKTDENDEEPPRKRRKLESPCLQSMKIDQKDECEKNLNSLTRAVALCRARIAHTMLEPQLHNENISYNIINVDKLGPQTANMFKNPNFSLTATVPLLELDRTKMLNRIRGAQDVSLWIFGKMYMRIIGWISSSYLQASLLITVEVQNKLLPSSINNQTFAGHVQFDTTNSVLSFRYENLENSVQNFLKDLESVVMISQLSSQVHPSDWEDDKTKLESFNFKTLEFRYSKDYTVQITWEPNGYLLHFGRLDGNESRNPHDRNKSHLETEFNITLDVKSLLSRLNHTILVAQALDNIESNYGNKQKNAGRQLCIFPISDTSARILWTKGIRRRNKKTHGVNITVLDNDSVLIADVLTSVKNYERERRKRLPPGIEKLPFWKHILDLLSQSSTYKSSLPLECGVIVKSHLTSNILDIINNKIQTAGD